MLLFFPIKGRKLSNASQKVFWSIGLCLFLGLFTELVQAFVLVDRSGDVPDMVANSFGVLLAVLTVRFFYKNWPWKVVNE
jgi:VanZ family protein